MSELKLIVGLGNPGKNYENTRHNLGFLVAKHFAEQHHLKFRSSSRCKGLVAEGLVADVNVCLLLPLTFMNNSGVAVKEIAAKKGIALENIFIVCDDFNLGFGQLRIRRQGSDGGHNGLSSVLYHLGENTFPRLRLGIGAPPDGEDAADFVLQKFTRNESKQLDPFIEEAADCCLVWLTQEMEKVMSQFNKRKEDE